MKEAIWIKKFVTELEVVPSIVDPVDLYQHPIFTQDCSVKSLGITSAKDKIFNNEHAQRHLRTT